MMNERKGTGMRPGTKKAIDDTVKSVGYNTQVNAGPRPVTQQGGLEGLKTAMKSRPGRQIKDRYYYINLLKKKTSDILGETATMKSEIETINKQINEFNTLNKTFETLAKEVQNLEGELADYNLAGDKFRSNMRSADIESIYNHIRVNNKKKREESDSLYILKGGKEEELQSIEYDINSLMHSIEQRLMDLDPEQKLEYDSLREENQNIIMRIHELKEEMSRLNLDIMEGENILKNNSFKKEAHRLKEQIHVMKEKREELELQTNDAGLSVEELKQRLVNKSKTDSQEKLNIEKKIADLKKVLENYKKSVSEIEKEMKNNQSESIQAHDSISIKDKEYSNFIENFDQIKKNEIRNIQIKEQIILALLEHLSDKLVGISDKEGNNSELSKIQKDIERKAEIVDKSISTLEEARKQYEQLQVKMQRLDNLEENLKNDIKMFKEKIEKANSEINEKFDRIESQKDYYKSEKEKMTNLLKFLESNRDNYNKLLTTLVLKNKAKANQLEEIETGKRLKEMEKKMQENEKYIFNLISYIDSKSNEADYAVLMKECLDIQAEINNALINKTLSVNI